MYLSTRLLVTYALLQTAAAFQLPFYIPWVSARLDSNDGQIPLALPQETPLNRIAIVGAGAGGSSAAFWISKAKKRYGLDVEVDVFESSSYVGGRSTTVYPYDDPSLEPIELGASIFVKANKNLWRASEEFGFDRKDFDEDDSMGIWDGEQFLLTTSGGGRIGGWWDTLKVLWRYGYKAPTRTKAIVDGMIQKFLTLYSPCFGSRSFTNLTTLAEELGWTEMIGQTTADYFDGQGIDPRWTREMIESATRVNYGQNADEIHALEGMCSLAATGASQIKGGNWLIFDQFLKRSNATVFLNTTVTSVTQVHENKFTVRTRPAGSSSVGPQSESERHYRAVILAAPFHGASIGLSLLPSANASEPQPTIPPQPYVHLHVTLLATTSPHARSRYFNLGEKDTVPGMVLTTWEGVRGRGGGSASAVSGEGETANAREDGVPEFNSVSYHGKVRTLDGEPVKRVVGDKEEEEEWDAYPVLPPAKEFPPVKLGKGFYYVNAFEPFISTMETETIAARNVVELLMQEEFDASICKSDEEAILLTDDEDSHKDFVYGWDCRAKELSYENLELPL
ncbi:hypothetical protein EW026_g1609 [Hermanssonia centrifuga]|uniref:Prenylcysteine lyase domain-containing protein n=1 Tax=Hermanssonia centrifuga TaxID=98765 RepID=A0A4V3XB81_9APHY|nr:hypothetical protein EW026_g1609 [Hermanssonia centrifuga]